MRAEKIQLVQDIAALLDSSPHVFLVGYKGLTVAQFATLRTELAETGAECHVVPNRLFRKAAERLELDQLAREEILGDTALVTGGDDVVAVAKQLRKFAREHEPLVVKLGCLDGTLLAGAEAQKLADLPSREILLAQLLGVLQGPARNLVSVLNQKVASIVYVLQAYLTEREEVA